MCVYIVLHECVWAFIRMPLACLASGHLTRPTTDACHPSPWESADSRPGLVRSFPSSDLVLLLVLLGVFMGGRSKQNPRRPRYQNENYVRTRQSIIILASPEGPSTQYLRSDWVLGPSGQERNQVLSILVLEPVRFKLDGRYRGHMVQAPRQVICK